MSRAAGGVYTAIRAAGAPAWRCAGNADFACARHDPPRDPPNAVRVLFRVAVTAGGSPWTMRSGTGAAAQKVPPFQPHRCRGASVNSIYTRSPGMPRADSISAQSSRDRSDVDSGGSPMLLSSR